MLRYTLYISIALLAFGFGISLVPNLLKKQNTVSDKYTKFELIEIDSKWKLVPVNKFKASINIKNAESSTVKNIELRKPFCQDKTILPIWTLLLQDEYFISQSNEMFREPNCAKMFTHLKVDLNNDGQKEIILRAKVSDLCGATGNCGFWIFEKKGDKYRKILSASDYWEANEMGDQIKDFKHKGYRDILLKSHFSSSDTRFSTYKFNGQTYIENKCQVSIPAYDELTTSNLRWHFVSCKRYFEEDL